MCESDQRFVPVIQRKAGSYLSRMSIFSWINAYYQVRDVLQVTSEGLTGRRLLIVGPGAGIERSFLKYLGFDVFSVDIDPALRPDAVVSVSEIDTLGMQFDCVLCSHVLEHLPFELFEPTLAKLASISPSVILYLPIAGFYLYLFAGEHFRYNIRLFKYLRRFRRDHKFDGEHYWEINWRGQELPIIEQVIKGQFDILNKYHNIDWPYSYNFVLRRKGYVPSIEHQPPPATL